MKRYMQFYDNDGFMMLASDGVQFFDNRFSNETAFNKAAERVQKQAAAYLKDKENRIKPRQCYAQIMQKAPQCNGLVDKPVSDIRRLENPLY